jgi:hypothetical protein
MILGKGDKKLGVGWTRSLVGIFELKSVKVEARARFMQPRLDRNLPGYWISNIDLMDHVHMKQDL